MNTFIFALLTSFLFSFNPQGDFDTVKQQAEEQHKLILLNFSGSDWCAPCILTKKEIYDNTAFKAFADTSLVLLNADFPRQKKNLPSAEKQAENDMLAETYNKKGIFPMIVLMNAEGKVLKTWEGKPKESALDFIKEVQTYIYAAQ
ncbi:MAG: thioredoxin family protein [Chitinophagales bacterium]|nr:thioredoxin family protein [Chitinophagales bacterium]